MRTRQRLYQTCTRAACYFTGCCLAFVLLNVMLLGLYHVKNHFFKSSENPKILKYGKAIMQQAYPDLALTDIETLLDETYCKDRFEYEAFSQFRERPKRGRFVNVDDNGFRIGRDQGPWPPDPASFNVFIFGGSTTFGDGLADDETTSCALQQWLNDRDLDRKAYVYNFGRGAYYSSQECVFFERLLVEGHIPDLAIFVDGYNELCAHSKGPMFTNDLAASVDSMLQPRKEVMPLLLKKLPMWWAAMAINRRIERWSAAKVPAEAVAAQAAPQPDALDGSAFIDYALQRYRANQRLIDASARAFGVTPVFVWQPTSVYKYDQAYHIFRDGRHNKFLQDGFRYVRDGYGQMAERVQAEALGRNFLWCADIQQHAKEPLYVDFGHYNAKLSRQLAHHIGGLLEERGFLPGPQYSQSTAAPGNRGGRP